MKIFKISILVLMSVLYSISIYATDIYVDITYGSDGYDGYSWLTAKKTLAGGMSIAGPYDIIRVAAGTYTDNVVLKVNQALIGGYPAGGGDEDPTVWHTIMDSSSQLANSVVGAQGSVIYGFTIQHSQKNGIYSEHSFMVVDCYIHSNTLNGIQCSNTNMYILNCVVENNGESCSGIRIDNSASSYIQDCIINNNSFAGINLSNAQVYVRNNVLAYNGDGIRLISAEAEIINNIIAYNSASTKQGGYGIYCAGYSSAEINYNHLWSNTQDYAGCPAGIGNTYGDPKFANPTGGDFHLQANSPCIDAGDPELEDCQPPGLGELRSDQGAYGGGISIFVASDAPRPEESFPIAASGAGEGDVTWEVVPGGIDYDIIAATSSMRIILFHPKSAGSYSLQASLPSGCSAFYTFLFIGAPISLIEIMFFFFTMVLIVFFLRKITT